MDDVNWDRPLEPGRVAVDYTEQKRLFEQAREVHEKHKQRLRMYASTDVALIVAIGLGILEGRLQEKLRETNAERDAGQRRGSDLPGTGEPEA